jgi:hypothetical protein
MPPKILGRQPETLGSLYLGAELRGGNVVGPVHFDARDLTTHGVCVGMTGSGKTGLCVGIIEEAALDGIPAIIVDPKGDMGNLLLHFPDLAPRDFLPWINSGDARRAGLDPEAYATQIAEVWRSGLQSWGIDKKKVEELSTSVERRVFTPGSTTVAPINLLGQFSRPAGADEEETHERSHAIGSALLGLIGIDTDPTRSRELSLLAVLIEYFWQEALTLDIRSLIRAIPDPPVRRFGVFDIDTFLPEEKRFELAMRFNTLLASPSFSAWLLGRPLDIDSLLFTSSGKPQHSIFYLAHLSEEERMFFVTLLLENLVTWMRRQPGTTSLRTLLYFDEIRGYLPPVAKPASKRPLMTILKQGRAFGLGAILATQNPVDIDYKALSNAGTWFIGRLQTERDRTRLIGGLPNKGASSAASLEEVVAGLKKREFLLHSVYEDEPIVFRTRWAMNYLRGPLTRAQLAQIQPPTKPDPGETETDQASVRKHDLSVRPALPPGLDEAFIVETALESRVLSSSLGVKALVRYVSQRHGIDVSRTELILVVRSQDQRIDWADALQIDSDFKLEYEPPHDVSFRGALPSFANTQREISAAIRSAKDYLYRNRSLVLKYLPDLDLNQEPDESDEAFHARLQLKMREARDAEIDAFVERQEVAIQKLEERLRRKELDVAEKEVVLRGRQQEEWIGLGETVLGMFLGRRRRRLSSTASKRRMTMQAENRLERVLSQAEDLKIDIQQFRSETQKASEEIARKWTLIAAEPEDLVITPRRADISVDFAGVVWHNLVS